MRPLEHVSTLHPPISGTHETLSALALECLNLSGEISEYVHLLSNPPLEVGVEAEQHRLANCTRALWARDALISIRNQLAHGTP